MIAKPKIDDTIVLINHFGTTPELPGGFEASTLPAIWYSSGGAGPKPEGPGRLKARPAVSWNKWEPDGASPPRPGGLARLIDHLADDPDARRTMGERGRRYIVEYASRANLAAQLDGILSAALDRRRGRW